MTRTGETPLLLLLLAPAASAAICAALIMLLRPLLLRYAMARPNARSSHRIPTPQGGGIAVIAATILVTLAAVVLGVAPVESGLFMVTGATILVAIVGGIDDVRPIAVLPRLLLQALAVVVMVTALPSEMRIAPLLPWIAERALLVIAGLWFVNLVNFMDGLDWMTVAEVVPVSGALALIGIATGMPPIAVIVAVALLGGMLGFAPFNRPVARLFLGDVGSLPVGLLLAWLLFLTAGHGCWAAAALLPLYYLADATLTLLRRLLRGEPIWQAHRSHFYQQATDNGLRVPQVVGRVFAVNVALAILAGLTVAMPSTPISIAALTLGAGLVTWLLWDFASPRLPARQP